MESRRWGNLIPQGGAVGRVAIWSVQKPPRSCATRCFP